jgi:hypothetical protein
MERLTERLNDDMDAIWVKDHDYITAAKKLACYEDLEEQGRLLELPCVVGDTVYVIETCEDVEKILDGTMYDSDGGPGTATGYYCPYYLNNNCPHEEENDCAACRKKLAVFEDTVKGFGVYEGYTMLYTERVHYCASIEDNFNKTVFLTKPDAEQALKDMQEKFMKHNSKGSGRK